MRTAFVQPAERVKLIWWQHVIVALGFVVVVFAGSTTGHVLFNHSSVAAAIHAKLWPPGLVIWFVFGLIFSPFFVRRRGKS